jgi:histone deacetylase 1/2
MRTRSKDGIHKPKVLTSVCSSPIREPSSYKEAQHNSNWVQAMQDEFDALKKNDTWILVPYSYDLPVIGSKWVYKVKLHANGSIDRYKARLVAQGFNQKYGIDYFETFSPVVKPTTIRVVLTVALSKQWPIHQLDVHNAFLNGELREDVYMKQPPGFLDSNHPSYVCKLRKAIYGLKQAPRTWYTKLHSALQKWGFTNSNSDASLFLYNSDSTQIFVLVYVDDIIVTGSSKSLIQKLISYLNTHFALKDLGQLHYFLGIELHFSKGVCHLSQTKYIQELLSKADLNECKPIATPMASDHTLSIHEGTLLEDPTSYRSLVGALQYCTITRPDLSFAVNKVCQFLHAPTDIHYRAVKRILRYLKGTLYHGLVFHSSPNLDLVVYTDADWASCPDDRKSTGGYCAFLGSNLVSWSSSKQGVVSRSSAESEYRALADGAAEVKWLETLLGELKHPLKSPPLLLSDNISATYLAANPVFHARTKHVEIDHHFVRDRVVKGTMYVRHTPSQDQLADVLTKALGSQKFLGFRHKLCVLHRP